MQISNNTGHPLSVSEVYIAWNHNDGHAGEDTTLRLRTITINNQSWDGDILAPSQYIRGYQPVIPIGSSIIYFGFNQNYDNLNGTERVMISLLTPGCEGYLIDSSK